MTRPFALFKEPRGIREVVIYSGELPDFPAWFKEELTKLVERLQHETTKPIQDCYAISMSSLLTVDSSPLSTSKKR